MAKHHEVSGKSMDPTTHVVSLEQKDAGRSVITGRWLMAASRYCGEGPPGATCQSGSVAGQRQVDGFVSDEMTAPFIRYSSLNIFA